MKARCVWSQLYMFQRVYSITCRSLIEKRHASQCHCTGGPLHDMVINNASTKRVTTWQDSNLCTMGQVASLYTYYHQTLLSCIPWCSCLNKHVHTNWTMENVTQCFVFNRTGFLQIHLSTWLNDFHWLTCCNDCPPVQKQTTQLLPCGSFSCRALSNQWFIGGQCCVLGRSSSR